VIKEQVITVAISLFIHAIIVLLVIQLQSNIPSVGHQHNNVIKSYLYVKPKILSISKQQSVVKTENNRLTSKQVKINAKNKPIRNTNNEKKQNNSIPPLLANPALLINKNKIQSEKRLRGNNLIPKKNIVSAANALAKLQNKIAASIIAKGSDDFYKQSVANKNKIDKSIASSIKKSERPTNKVDCSSNLNHGIALVSNYLGGTVTCKTPPNIDKFINNRLTNLGVQKNKK